MEKNTEPSDIMPLVTNMLENNPKISADAIIAILGLLALISIINVLKPLNLSGVGKTEALPTNPPNTNNKNMGNDLMNALAKNPAALVTIMNMLKNINDQKPSPKNEESPKHMDDKNSPKDKH
jgi:hypothetical protein